MSVIIRLKDNIHYLYSIHSDTSDKNNLITYKCIGILESLDNILQIDIEYPMLNIEHFTLSTHVPTQAIDDTTGKLHDYLVYELNKKSQTYIYHTYQIAQTNAKAYADKYLKDVNIIIPYTKSQDQTNNK